MEEELKALLLVCCSATRGFGWPVVGRGEAKIKHVCTLCACVDRNTWGSVRPLHGDIKLILSVMFPVIGGPVCRSYCHVYGSGRLPED